MLLLVRHGETEANRRGQYLGRADLELTSRGRAQAEALAGVLPRPDVVVSSPLRRARQTAESLAAAIEIDERWIELDYGPLRPAADRAGAGGRCTSAGDTTRTLPRRAWRHSRRCRRGSTTRATTSSPSAEASVVIVVTHVGPIKAALGWALGVPSTVARHLFVEDAGVSRIDIVDGSPSRAVVQPVRPSAGRAHRRIGWWSGARWVVGRRGDGRLRPACRRSAWSTARRWIAPRELGRSAPVATSSPSTSIVDQAAQRWAVRHPTTGTPAASASPTALPYVSTPARERERIGGRVQGGDGRGVEWAVDDDSIDEVGLFASTPDAGGVFGVDVGATREVQGHVVVRERGDGVEQLEDPLVGQPVGDVEQSEAAPGPQAPRRAPTAGGRSPARRLRSGSGRARARRRARRR